MPEIIESNYENNLNSSESLDSTENLRATEISNLESLLSAISTIKEEFVARQQTFLDQVQSTGQNTLNNLDRLDNSIVQALLELENGGTIDSQLYESIAIETENILNNLESDFESEMMTAIDEMVAEVNQRFSEIEGNLNLDHIDQGQSDAYELEQDISDIVREINTSRDNFTLSTVKYAAFNEITDKILEFYELVGMDGIANPLSLRDNDVPNTPPQTNQEPANVDEVTYERGDPVSDTQFSDLTEFLSTIQDLPLGAEKNDLILRELSVLANENNWNTIIRNQEQIDRIIEGMNQQGNFIDFSIQGDHIILTNSSYPDVPITIRVGEIPVIQ